jgi:glycosyltransferase involved in cell wall biosynthesis
MQGQVRRRAIDRKVFESAILVPMGCLRVAHVSPSYFADESLIGGGERYVSNVARALETVRDMFPIEQAIFAIGKTAHQFLDGAVPVHILPNENPSPHPMAAISGRLWAELADFDLIHVHQSLTFFGAYCAVVAKSLRKILVMTDLGGGNNPLMLGGRGLQLADGLVSISQFSHSLIAPYHRCPHEVVIGPVDTIHFSPSAATRERSKSSICVGRILPHKGIDRIITALPDNLPLTVVGRIYDNKYFQVLKDLSKYKHVTFVSDADDEELLHQYRTATLFLQGSTFRDCFGNSIQKPELMGLTTLEAMACGLPVIVSDAASLPELATDRAFGQVFESEDHLRELFRAYMTGYWPAPNAGILARRHVEEKHSFRAVGHKLATFYTSLRK